MVAFKSYLMHDPPNSQLFLANLELAPFLDDFDGPVGLHGCVITLSPFMSYENNFHVAQLFNYLQGFDPYILQIALCCCL